MFRKSKRHGVQFQPFALTMQSRFRFKPKEETDNFRRLMDSTAFPVDWMGAGARIKEYGGHWTHLITCAHCLAPWEYPNFYPPVGSTKWVSKLTMEDTMNTIRIVDKQGVAIHKHFTCRQTQYVHINKKLDLAVFHPDQSGNRRGEEKMMWLQNEGWVKRPRLEMIQDLNIGDEVRIYGFQAYEEGLLDTGETPREPLMIPIGIKGVVKSLEQEHFFIQPHVNEPEILMGLCGAPVMRNGKCVGMLAAKVHELSPNKVLAGTAMCTYSHDIRLFLLEVEKQMKALKSNKEDFKFTIARHLSVSLNNDTGIARLRQQYLKSEEDPTKQDPEALWYQQGGIHDQENQENMGVHMANSRVGEKPKNSEEIYGESNFVPRGLRADPNSAVDNSYDSLNRENGWLDDENSTLDRHLEEFAEGSQVYQGELDRLKEKMTKLRSQRQREETTSSAFNNSTRSSVSQQRASTPEWMTGLSRDGEEGRKDESESRPSSFSDGADLNMSSQQQRMLERKARRKEAETSERRRRERERRLRMTQSRVLRDTDDEEQYL